MCYRIYQKVNVIPMHDARTPVRVLFSRLCSGRNVEGHFRSHVIL